MEEKMYILKSHWIYRDEIIGKIKQFKSLKTRINLRIALNEIIGNNKIMFGKNHYYNYENPLEKYENVFYDEFIKTDDFPNVEMLMDYYKGYKLKNPMKKWITFYEFTIYCFFVLITRIITEANFKNLYHE